MSDLDLSAYDSAIAERTRQVALVEEAALQSERAARADYGDAMLSLAVDATLHDLGLEALYAPADQRSYLTRLRSQLTSSRDTYETTGTQRNVTLAYLSTALEHLDTLWQQQALDAAVLAMRRERAYRRFALALTRDDQPRRIRTTTTTREA